MYSADQLVLLLHGSLDGLDLPSAAWTQRSLRFPPFSLTHLFFFILFFFALIKLLKVFLIVLKTDRDNLIMSDNLLLFPAPLSSSIVDQDKTRLTFQGYNPIKVRSGMVFEALIPSNKKTAWIFSMATPQTGDL